MDGFDLFVVLTGVVIVVIVDCSVCDDQFSNRCQRQKLYFIFRGKWEGVERNSVLDV